jgi:peptidoglycan DL-endopeptidase LytE
MEVSMSAKKVLQFILLVAILVTSFASSTGVARAASSCGTSYTVVSGDTLRKIATRCDTTVSALRRANPEIGTGDLIYPGQSLLLPGALINGGSGLKIYIIARGDTLKALAIRFNTTLAHLLNLNPQITNANVIYEGQRLTVPANGGGTDPTPAPSGRTYTVKQGDTLKKIAAWTSTTLEALLKANPQIANANVIYPGQVINLPASVNSYIVQSGDTLKKIAARFNTTLENLLAVNPNIGNADKIYVGQVIRLW